MKKQLTKFDRSKKLIKNFNIVMIIVGILIAVSILGILSFAFLFIWSQKIIYIKLSITSLISFFIIKIFGSVILETIKETIKESYT